MEDDPKSEEVTNQDEDGVLSFPELGVVMKSLGQRPRYLIS